MPAFRPDPDDLARRIAALEARPARVAIEGIDCSGKTTLAGLVSPLVAALGRPVIRAEGDGFLRPREQRYRRGAESPEGYALDTVDYEALRSVLLDPLGPGGSRRYLTAVRSEADDRPLEVRPETAPEESVLIVDGVFLQRPEVRDCWDLVVWIDVPFEEALRRALLRDADRFGGREVARARYLHRYLPGQRSYLEECRPRQRADVVVVTGD